MGEVDARGRRECRGGLRQSTELALRCWMMMAVVNGRRKLRKRCEDSGANVAFIRYEVCVVTV
jgi:hypothetical protein